MKASHLWRWIVPLILLSGLWLPSASCQEVETPAAQASEPTHPELAAEIIRRMDEDQRARQQWIEVMNNTEGKTPEQIQADFEKIAVVVNEIDTRNREWLATKIEELGWPGKSLVGEQAAHAAWLLVQHADGDREFQEKCLERMKAAAEGEVAVIDIAYLTDRVLVGKGEPQIYGTQCRQVDGKFEPQTCVEPEKLDERRQSVGLPPMSEYLKQLAEVYGGGRE